MIAYKLFRVRKNGTLGSLFINRKAVLEPGVWLEAETYPTRGYALATGWHCCTRPGAPHLSTNGRQWWLVEIEDVASRLRPASQGGMWYVARKMRILERVEEMGRKSKEKGKRGEREAAKAIEDFLGIGARRGVQYTGSADSPDVEIALPNIHVEVKRTETLSLYPAVEQATQDGGEKIPLVLHRRNHKDWLAIVPLSRLMELAVTLYLTRADN